MDLEDLCAAYEYARRHNRRSEDMVSFEMNLYANLYELCAAVNSKTFSPSRGYSFIHRRSYKPREVFAATPEVKILQAYALMRIAPLIERHLSDRTFNNRVGKGSKAAINAVAGDMYAATNGFTTPAWIIKMDLRGYFPNMLQSHAWEQFKNIVLGEYRGQDKDDVLYCLSMACFLNPQAGAYKKSPLWEWADVPAYKSLYMKPLGTGGAIGYLFWQTAASLYPVDVDSFIMENITPYYARYVDDMVMIVKNKEMALAMIPEIRRRFAEIGQEVHKDKFYCQPAEHGVEFLGYYIMPGRIHLKRRIIDRAFAVAGSRDRGRRNYMDAINSYLGMIKSTSDLAAAKALLDAVTRKGFRKDYENYKLIMI